MTQQYSYTTSEAERSARHAERAAARTEVTFTVCLAAPLSEEKLRYGCLLQADCLICPHHAVHTAPCTYRITYDAHISLFLSCHACCS